jgi:hypothetical protein
MLHELYPHLISLDTERPDIVTMGVTRIEWLLAISGQPYGSGRLVAQLTKGSEYVVIGPIKWEITVGNFVMWWVLVSIWVEVVCIDGETPARYRQ